MRLLGIFKPKYPDVIANHITHQYPASLEDYLPYIGSFKVVGISDDGKGLEALVISLDGKTKRPDKEVYHITWSIDKGSGYKPSDSIAVISRFGVIPVNEAIINMVPTLFIPGAPPRTAKVIKR